MTLEGEGRPSGPQADRKARPALSRRAFDYLRDPGAIYAESFATIEREADLGRFGPGERAVAIRLIHACGMTDIAGGLHFSGNAVAAGLEALSNGRPVLCDAEMVAHGIIRRFLPEGVEVLCTLNDPRTPDLAAGLETTRSAAAVELWRERLDGAIVAIGNAPTALFHLLERLGEGWPRPALILGFPVGFVGAAESKEALLEAQGAEFVTLSGRRGGSAMAAAAVNAIARLAQGGEG